MVSGYLRDAGWQVTLCANGREGLRALEAAPEKFQLVLTDLEMPDMDGWELIKAIRSQTAFDRLPVMALTSLADESARQRTLQCGADMHAVKIDRDGLLAAIAKLATARSAP